MKEELRPRLNHEPVSEPRVQVEDGRCSGIDPTDTRQIVDRISGGNLANVRGRLICSNSTACWLEEVTVPHCLIASLPLFYGYTSNVMFQLWIRFSCR